ncbi:MAG: protease modulator HflC [Pseudomonadota bacterium]
MRRLPIIAVVVVVLAYLGLSSVYIVDEREKALVLQFGQVRAVQEEPGLAFKLPFVQNVVRYDDRILSLDTQPLEVTPLDDRRLVVDAYARYRISDVVRFRQAVGAGGIATADQRLETILTAQLRQALGSVDSGTVLSADRVALMTQIRDAARVRAAALGLDVVDVRIKRADLPEANLAATFERMNAEREREARDERARGQEAAQITRAQADRRAVELVSEAQRDSEIIRGEADAERNAIFAEAFGRDPEFFAFYRSLRAYENALTGDNSTLVITPDSEFFDYLDSDAAPTGSAPRPAAEPQAALEPATGGTETAAATTGGTAVVEE